MPSARSCGCQWPTALFGTHGEGPNRPSPWRAASIAAEAAWPAAMPSVLACDAAIAPSAASRAVATESSRVCRFGNAIEPGTPAISAARTSEAAVAIAASSEAPGNRASRRYGSRRGTIAFTASYTAPCTMAKLTWSAGGAPPAGGGNATSVAAVMRFQSVIADGPPAWTGTVDSGPSDATSATAVDATAARMPATRDRRAGSAM